MSDVLFVDPFSGVSGDMFVGALVDLGVPLAQVRRELAKVGFGGYRLKAGRVRRGALAATRFEVLIEGKGRRSEGVDAHGHGHEDDHRHAHPHGVRSGGGKTRAHGHRTFADIRRLIRGSGLSRYARERSLDAFRRLAEAEGRLHGEPPDAVRFHEVGAVDSLVDIIGAFVAVEALSPIEIVCGPVPLGSGFVKCAHGVLPVPAPATLEMMRGVPVRPTDREGELTTPTGALLVSSLASSFGPIPAMTVEKIGYGAGMRDDPAMPNVLRVVLGRRREPGKGAVDSVVEIAADVDDSTPETLGFLHERLASSGALDVVLSPVTMKKGRPGVEIVALCPEGALGAVADAIFAETTTFGLRFCRKERMTLARDFTAARTPWGAVRVKVGRLGGRVVTRSPEFEDCRRIAVEKKVPLRRVYAAAVRAAGTAGEE